MGGTGEIARALAAASDHLRRHPEAGRVADRTATVVVTEGLRCRATDPLGNVVGTDMPPGLGGDDAGPTPAPCCGWPWAPARPAARRPLPVSVELETG
jgi:hypothetical protein